MELADVEAIPLEFELPAELPVGDARGYSEGISTTLIRLETSTGRVGWGEAFAGGRTAATLFEESFASDLVGESPYLVESLAERSYVEGYHFGGGPYRQSLISGIDIACWDLIGQATGEPVHHLLGGHRRENVVPYASTMYLRDGTEDPAEPLEAAAAEGFSAAKIKIGRNLEDDHQRIRLARDILGEDADLMVDVNGNYRPKQALELDQILREYDVSWFEEPVPPENISGYRQLQGQLRTPIAAGEAHFGRFEFKQLIDDRLVDIVQPNVTRCGGFSEARRIADMATTENIAVRPHVWNSAVGLVAAIHFLASVPQYPHSRFAPEPLYLEFDRNPNPLRSELLVSPIDPTGGSVSVPDSPGLGIEVDQSAIETHRID